jgi:hypothetical protein
MNDGNFRMRRGGVPAKRAAGHQAMHSGAGSAPALPAAGNRSYGQLFTRFVALTVPIPVAKSQPVVVP